jgi:hypothetical protein
MMDYKNRTGCAVLALALLLAGCAHASEGDVDTSAEQGETITSEETKVEASGNHASGETVGLPSEDYQPGIGNSTVMETESGFYYYGFPHLGATYKETPGICYHDLETGTDIYLCSKPECAHDGNAYCVATSNEWIEDYALYEGVIYMVDAQVEDETTEWKLYRIAADGTEKTEIGSFAKMKNVYSSSDFDIDLEDAKLICHRTKAVYAFAYCDESTGGTEYACRVMDLKTGKCEEIELENDAVKYSAMGLESMRADGEWLYFGLTNEEVVNWSTVSTRTYWRYNLETAETEQLDLPENLYSYTVFDGKVYYTQRVPGEKLVQIWVYDTQTQEITALCSAYENDLKGTPSLTTDGTYLYYADTGFSWNSRSSKEPSAIHVLTFTGEEMDCFQMPTMFVEGAIDDDQLNYYVCSCYFKKGTAYLTVDVSIEAVPSTSFYTREVLDTEAEWEKLCEVHTWI